MTMNVFKLVFLAVTAFAVVGCLKKEEPKKTEAPQSVAPVTQPQAQDPVAGATVVTLGVTVDQVETVAKGWSVKKQILGLNVFNDSNEKVGNVYDIIVAPDKAISYGIISAGGFLGIDKHDVAIPVNQFKFQDGKLILPGATKDAIKAMPPFTYNK
jgi:hypothetical protein